ncbi:hypothetical protein DS62_11330 [Smithella sp. SC_K08D17]|nr:hypothetical protein KD27_05030 [Smithella sp. D17]KIE18385.1 hypothetical protein DS62_11330 [Smithella sp. SC_K08D17]
MPGMGANYQNERSLTEPTAATVAERQGGTRKGKLEEAEGRLLPEARASRSRRARQHRSPPFGRREAQG